MRRTSRRIQPLTRPEFDDYWQNDPQTAVEGTLPVRGVWPLTFAMINNPKLLWLIPPVCGIISATFIYGLIFIGVVDDSVGLVRFLEGTFTWVLWLIDMLNIGPHGCEGMIWLGLAPGIAWFLFGAVLGAIWAFVIFQRLRRSGQMPPRIDYREVAAEIQARPDYENFIQEDPKRRHLYYEQLPLEFDKWLQQRRDT